jgi:hypothetical protein
MSVGVMEDYKLRDLRASHTLKFVSVTGTVRCLFATGNKKGEIRGVKMSR